MDNLNNRDEILRERTRAWRRNNPEKAAVLDQRNAERRTARYKSDPEFKQKCISASRKCWLNNRAQGLCGCGRKPDEGYKTCTSCRNSANKTYHKYGPRYAATMRERTKQRRNEVLDHYGPCFCCGESNKDFLEIDHIGGWGKDHVDKKGKRIKGNDLYRWIIENNFPDTLRSLCANCHAAITFRGICPHQQKKETHNEK